MRLLLSFLRDGAADVQCDTERCHRFAVKSLDVCSVVWLLSCCHTHPPTTTARGMINLSRESMGTTPVLSSRPLMQNMCVRVAARRMAGAILFQIPNPEIAAKICGKKSTVRLAGARTLPCRGVRVGLLTSTFLKLGSTVEFLTQQRSCWHLALSLERACRQAITIGFALM